MMKKLTFVLLYLIVNLCTVVAQNVKVTGSVISADDGLPVIGASIVVKGTMMGTVTDYDGKFSLDVPSDSKVLVISYVGMVQQEVSVKPVLKIELKSDTQNLEEVVVTAMGIKRSEKSIGFAATSVGAEEISAKQTGDIMSGLAGKVAGVQISSTSSDPGASNSVVIRGMSSLSGSNQPLYVVDGVPLSNSAQYSNDGLNAGYDYGNGANAVNPNDVESMTILKGAAATALYGSRAAAGVVLITTKSGQQQKKGIGVEYNGGVQFESVLRLPEMQNEFGMGWNGNHTLLENGSWGPRLDGSMQLWGNPYNNSQKLKPFVALKDNLKDFFDTGLRYSNNVAFNAGNENGNYYVSFSQLSNDGIIPTDADTYDKYTFSTRGSYKVKDLTISSSVNYTTQKNNFAQTGQGLTMINSIYQIPRDVSIIGLKDLNDPFNQMDYYFTPYGVMNPYYILENAKNEYKADKIFGKMQLDYDFLKYFRATYRIGLDATNSENKIGTPEMFASEGTPNYGQIKTPGTVKKEMVRQRELNHDFLVTFDMPVSDFHINALAGLNVNERTYSRQTSSIEGLDIPTWYNLSNSASTPIAKEYEYKRRLVGLFGQAEVGYKSMLYLTLTARNDWSSTLPEGNRGFFYPGVTGSFIFTELMPEESKDILSFGKVRLAWGQTGNDANVYMIDPYFQQADVSLGFGNIKFPLKGVNAFTEGNTLGNPTLSPEITTEFEVGGNLSFFNGRISIDGSYYSRTSDKQIFSLNMDPSTGYTYQNINLGEISNKGVELLVSLTPVQTRDFKWDVTWNFTKNNSKVVSLPEELGGSSLIYGFSGGTGMYAVVGQPLGMFKAEVVERDPNGNVVVNQSTGIPVTKTDFEFVGDMNYDYEMGISTTLSYKGFSLGADLDIRQGGLMFSRTKNINYFVGNAIQTAYNDRNTFIVPGSVNKVVAEDGTVSYKENTTPVPSGQIYDYWDKGATQGDSKDLIDKSYIKLRSLVFGWELPKKWLRNTFLTDVKLSVFGNNLFVWTPSENTFIDPEMTSFGNDLEGRFGEYSANPSTRKYGFNVMVKF